MMLSNWSRPRTKIVCTLGPSVQSPSRIQWLVEAGMNVARLNMAHGTLEDHTTAFGHVRYIAQELKQPVGIMVDVPGPKYRTGHIPSGSLSFREGEEITLTSRQNGEDGEIPVVPVRPAGIHRDARIGNRILLSDGMITLAIREVRGEDVLCQALTPGKITSGRGVTTAGVEPSLPFLDEKALTAMEFAAQQQADFVALSTVTTSDDVVEARKILSEMGFEGGIYSKIERARAVTNQASITDVSDGIIVARGDLGTEIRLARVPIVQKELIALCNEAGKPVITATQMLESMVSRPSPTRAEASDVANAVFDGSSALMLSGETAIGTDPANVVRTMDRIAQRADEEFDYELWAERLAELRMTDDSTRDAASITDAMTMAAWRAADGLGISTILAISGTGFTVRSMARFRPHARIIGLSHNSRTVQQLTLSWGTTPVLVKDMGSNEEMVRQAVAVARDRDFARSGEIVGILAGADNRSRSANVLRLERVP
jgi:pyruvate kinase